MANGDDCTHVRLIFREVGTIYIIYKKIQNLCTSLSDRTSNTKRGTMESNEVFKVLRDLN